MFAREHVVQALGPVINALASLEVRHYLGGSLASSWHGAGRSTMDADIVAKFPMNLADSFFQLLTPEYYLSKSAIEQAVRQKSAFNAIHLPTSFKIDVFVSKGRRFDQACFDRAVKGRIGGPEGVDVLVASAEDTIISKLEWYRAGNEISDRQWQDARGVLALLGEKADMAYLREAANMVGVADLLDRLVTDVDPR